MKRPAQIAPAKAKEYKNDEAQHPFWADNMYVAEYKYDDVRALMHIGKSINQFTTRVIGKDGFYAEKTNHVPHLSGVPIASLEGTVLDGGLGYVLDPSKKSSDVMKVLGCLPEKAVELQQSEDKALDYVIWDVLFYKGKDVRRIRLSKRRKILESLFPVLKRSLRNSVYLTEQVSKDKKGYYESIVSKGGEGVMIKHMNAFYGVGWHKVKKDMLIDCFVMGYKEPKATSMKSDGTVSTTKYHEKGWIGAVVLGQYVRSGRKYVRTIVGNCSGFPEIVRKRISENPDKYLNKVLEVKVQERLPTGGLRHPRFMRWRNDKTAKMCLYDPTGGTL